MTKLLSHPAVKMIGVQVSKEVTRYGLVGAIDKVIDYCAEKVAWHMVQAEMKQLDKER
jgi:hypothetical protein